MAYSESGTFTSPRTHIKIQRAAISRQVSNVNTTGSGDSAAEFSISGIEILSGAFSGWSLGGTTTAALLWTTDTGTITFATTDGVQIQCTTAIIERTDASYNYSANNRKVIPISCTFRMSGTISYSRT